MGKKLSVLISLMLLLGMALTACGGTAPATTQPTAAPAAPAPTAAPQPAEAPVTLRLLIHQNAPLVDYMAKFNEKFQAKYPNIAVDTSVVKADELATSTQTRLTANDVDIVDIFGFAQKVQPYMKNVDKPNWQSLIEAGLLLDLSDQAFLKNYDESALKDAGTFEGKVYQVNTGRYAFTGVFYNKDLFEKNGVKVPTTWSELVATCETFKKAKIGCMTGGGKDGWPILVGAYGILLSEYPDQEALVEGLWTGKVKWNDAKSLEMWTRMQQFANFMEEGASGISFDAAPGRFASGAVAMYPAGTWDAPAIEKANPDIKYGYFPMPGSDKPEDNKYLAGKYDVGFAVAAKSPNKDAALKWLEFFSEPANYQEYVNAVGILPTQPKATLDTTLGKEVQPHLSNFRLGYELYYVAPKGAGQWAQPNASFFKPFNEWDDAKKLADQAQADLEAGLNAK
jgi:raffinose/stachyose/melibiose transport system substrate-binding protein